MSLAACKDSQIKETGSRDANIQTNSDLKVPYFYCLSKERLYQMAHHPHPLPPGLIPMTSQYHVTQYRKK